jgi:aminopeptidase N
MPTTAPDVGAVGIGDPYFPTMGNGGYDAQHYTLDLDVDLATDRIEGSATLTALAAQELSRFNLDFAGFEIGALLVNGQPAAFERAGAELSISPARSIAEGEEFTVEVSYSGRPGEDVPAGAPEYTRGWVNYGSGVMVAGEPSGAENWYPVNGHPGDKATYSFRITVDEPHVVAANGLLEEVVDNGSTTTYVWELRDPAASYLVTLAIGDFDVETDRASSGVPIRNYFAAGVPASTRDSFDTQADMIDYYETVFGPYPFEAYGVVVHNQPFGFALETQTLSIFGVGFTWEDVVAHELAHQWFGDSVSLARWQDIWLNEGFATYAQVLWVEHQGGELAVETRIREMYFSTLAEQMASSSQPAQAGSFIIGDPSPDALFDRRVYDRGGLTLHALRLQVGDEAFFAILRTYADRFRDGNATTDDFIALCEEIAGQELDDLFDAWLYQPDLPDIPELGLTFPGG